MAFSMDGTRGTIRHRIHPKNAEVRGPRGVVGKHDKQATRKKFLDRTRGFQFEGHAKAKPGLLAGIRRIFTKARGNR